MFVLASCSKSASDYAKEGEKLKQELSEAIANNDTEKQEELAKKAEELSKEVMKKCQENPEFAAEMQKVLLDGNK